MRHTVNYRRCNSATASVKRLTARCIIYHVSGGAFLELLDADHGQPSLQSFFDGPYILNTYGGVLNLPNDASYVARVHRDQRTFSGDLHLMAQILVMLDDFTEANGATYLLTGSHRCAERPPDELFFRDAVRAAGAAGSILVFDSEFVACGRRQPHRRAAPRPDAGVHAAVHQAATRLPAGARIRTQSTTLSPALRQLLGYNARVPVSLDEWYQPPERRLYKRDQG